MATVLQAVPTAQIETVWKEEFTSESINQRFRGLGRGVRRGFYPVIGASNDELELNIDARVGDSVAEVGGLGGQTDITIQIRETGQVLLDLSSLAAADYYIGIRPGYTTGLTTTASYVAYTAAEVTAGTPGTEGVVLLCRVTTTGNVGPLTDINFGDSLFIREDFNIVQGGESGSILSPVVSHDMGSLAPTWFGNTGSSFDGQVRVTDIAGSTGLGVLEIEANAPGESWMAGFTHKMPTVQGDVFVVEIRYQSNSTINPATSSIRLQTTGGVFVDTVTLPDTGGAWSTFQCTLEQSSDEDWSRLIFQLEFSAAGSVYVDRVSVFQVNRNEDTGSDRAVSRPGVQSAQVMYFADLNRFGLSTYMAPEEGSVQVSTSTLGGYETPGFGIENRNYGVATASADGTNANATGFGFTRVTTGSVSAQERTFVSVVASTINAAAGAGLASYFTFDDGSTSYYVWYNVDNNSDSDPSVGSHTGIEVQVRSSSLTDRELVLLTVRAIDASSADVSLYWNRVEYNEDVTVDVRGKLVTKSPVSFENTSDVLQATLGPERADELVVRDSTGVGIGAIAASNVPVAKGRISYDHGTGNWVLDYSSGLNTTFNVDGIDDDNSATPFVQLDTSIPIANGEIVIHTSTALSSTRTYVDPTFVYLSSTNVQVFFSVYDHSTDALVTTPLPAGLNGNRIYFTIYANRA